MKAVKEPTLERAAGALVAARPVAEAVYKSIHDPPGAPGDPATSGRPTPAGGRPASPTAPTRSTSSRSSRWPPSAWPGPHGARRRHGRGSGRAAGPRRGATGRRCRPHPGADRAAPERGGGPAYARSARRRSRSPGVVRRGRRLPRLRAHRDLDDAIGRWPASSCRAAGSPFPQPPAAPDAEQRLDRRPGARPARAVLADRALPGGGHHDRGGGEGRVFPSSTARSPLPERCCPTPASCLGAWRSRPRRRGFLARATEYQEAASIPRLLVLVAERR